MKIEAKHGTPCVINTEGTSSSNRKLLSIHFITRAMGIAKQSQMASTAILMQLGSQSFLVNIKRRIHFPKMVQLSSFVIMDQVATSTKTIASLFIQSMTLVLRSNLALPQFHEMVHTHSSMKMETKRSTTPSSTLPGFLLVDLQKHNCQTEDMASWIRRVVQYLR